MIINFNCAFVGHSTKKIELFYFSSMSDMSGGLIGQYGAGLSLVVVVEYQKYLCSPIHSLPLLCVVCCVQSDAFLKKIIHLGQNTGTFEASDTCGEGLLL